MLETYRLTQPYSRGVSLKPASRMRLMTYPLFIGVSHKSRYAGRCEADGKAYGMVRLTGYVGRRDTHRGVWHQRCGENTMVETYTPTVGLCWPGTDAVRIAPRLRLTGCEGAREDQGI